MAALRNIAVVGFAQAPIVQRDEHRINTEILYPQVRRALASAASSATRSTTRSPAPPTTSTAARSASSPRST
jgi:hypothetical protein